MAGKFNDKVVIVTGGSRGLGRAMSLGFAAEGARVVVASRKIASCENVVRQIEGLGGEALARSAHMGNLSDIDELIEAAYARFGRRYPCEQRRHQCCFWCAVGYFSGGLRQDVGC